MMLKLREFTNSAAILSVTLFHFLDYESANQTNLFQGQSESVGKDNMAAYFLNFLSKRWIWLLDIKVGGGV